MTARVLAILLVPVLLATPRGQVRTQRDVTPQPQTPAPAGTAVVAGVVTTGDGAGQPVRKASVTLSSGGMRIPDVVMTDDAGRFRFTGVAAGTYTLSATRPGYVSVFYGGKRPGKGPGVPIAVVANQQINNLKLRMLRGSVITGTIRLPSGQPAANVTVQVNPVQTFDGQRRVVTSTAALLAMAGGPTTTDDRGVYRAFGLAPGEYLIRANMRGFTSEARLVTSGEVQWAQQAASHVSSSVPGAAPPPLPTAPPTGQSVLYAPAYYPGTAVISEATTISVGAGEERAGVDFNAMLVPTARLSGVVLDPDGRPLAGARITLKPVESDPSDIDGLMGDQSGSLTGADGTFVMTGILPGRYSLESRGAPPRGRTPPADVTLDAILSARMFAGGAGGTAWWATEDVSVQGRDQPGLTLRMQPGLIITGKLVFDGTKPPPADITKGFYVSLGQMPTSSSPLQMAAMMMTAGTSVGTTAADGTITIKDVVPGKYRMTMNGGMGLAALAAMMGPAAGGVPANDWVLKTAMMNGVDIADAPLDVRPGGNVPQVVVTMTDRKTELTGSVIDQAGRATPNFPIVVFSTDRTYWTIGSRRVQQARPSSDGKFKISGLPPGEYYIAAVTDLDPEELYSAAFLDELRAAPAIRITLADGEKKNQDLRLNGGF